jgi:hypothetical protein
MLDQAARKGGFSGSASFRYNQVKARRCRGTRQAMPSSIA